jgi:hypothetical protein
MKIAFMHIPKTGGIATERVILNAMGLAPVKIHTGDREADQDWPAQVCPLYQPTEYGEKTFADAPGYDFYQGHFKYDFACTLPEDYLKVTVLRPPTDLILSLYNHIISRPAHPLHEQANADPKNLGLILNVPAGIANIQTAYVLGTKAYQDICLDPNRPIAERVAQMLDVARENLSTFDLVGSTAQLRPFIAQLQDVTGLTMPAPKHENANKFKALSRDTLSQENQDVLHRATWADRPLFKMAWNEFIAPRLAKAETPESEATT